MPVHPRTTARKNLVALIIAAGTAAGARVYESLYWPSGEGETPAVNVVINEDQVHEDDSTPEGLTDLGDPRPQRSIMFTIEARIATKTDPAAALDSLLREIEQAIDGDRTLSGALERIAYVDTEIEGMENTTPQAIEGVMTWRGIYVDDFS